MAIAICKCVCKWLAFPRLISISYFATTELKTTCNVFCAHQCNSSKRCRIGNKDGAVVLQKQWKDDTQRQSLCNSHLSPAPAADFCIGERTAQCNEPANNPCG